MKCTSCGEPVRPVVAIDLDGTLGDYHNHFLDFAEGYLGHNLPRQWMGQPRDWEEYLQLDRRTYRDIKLAYRQGGMKRTMPTFPNAEFLTNSCRMGAELWITTTRPYNRLDSVDPDTQEWLRRNNIRYDRLLYDDDKYLRLAELIEPMRVCMVLEDLPEQCAVAQEQFGWANVFMRSGDHNFYENSWQRVPTLLEARTQASVRIKGWYKEYATA